MDCFAQRIVGWHAATTKVTDLVLTPLRIAMWDRDRHGHPVEPGTLVCHSDAGSQPGFNQSKQHPDRGGVDGTAARVDGHADGTAGDAYDNGLMESIIGLYKTEAIATDVFHAGPLKTLVDVEYATAGWVDWWNHRRLHSSIGQIPPAEHEQDYYAALTREPHPV